MFCPSSTEDVFLNNIYGWKEKKKIFVTEPKIFLKETQLVVTKNF